MRWPQQGRELGGALAMLRRRKAKYSHALLPPAMQSSAWASRCVSGALRKMEQAEARWWRCSARARRLASLPTEQSEGARIG
jgi:hypothetical protein